MDKHKPAMTIDEVPLEWCFQPGVKLDFRHFPDGYVVTKQDVIDELQRIEHTLRPLEIVLVNTRAPCHIQHSDNPHNHNANRREYSLTQFLMVSKYAQYAAVHL